MKIIFKPLFQKYLLYCFKNTFAVMLIIFLEQICIFLSILSSLIGLFSEFANEEIKQFFDVLSKISPLNFIKNSLDCQLNNSTFLSICTANSLIILCQVLTTLIIVIFLGLFVMQEILQNNLSADNTAEKLSEKVSFSDCFMNFLTYCFVNFLDFIIHFCTLGIFYLNFNEIFGFLNLLNSINAVNPLSSGNSNSITLSNSIMPLLSTGFLAFYFYIYISFIKNINLIIQYNKELSTHYDHLFSIKYDLTNFLLKILISIEYAFETNKIISEKSLTFLKILILFVFVVFNFYLMISNFLMNKILYLANHKYNIFRILLSYFSLFSLILIISFHKIFFKNFYVVYICFFIALIIAIFFARLTNEKNYVAIYSTDNYILQLIYILNVKYNTNDKECNAEVSNIIFHHKNYCIYHKICGICKMENFEFDYFLHNFYIRVKQMLKNKSNAYNNFEKYDINTFDIIKLLIIENLDRNKIIKLIYKARRILEKYEVQKRYDNNYFNILIYNNYMKRLITKNQVLKFKIIQCYEDTSYHINKALAVIETMLLSLNNGEKQLFNKSSDLYELKDKISKNVLFLSYYQNYFVDTYSIIIYRYIYKNLFNCDINDYVTIYNFEEIKDLINYMFDNEKLIQIKLNFNNNSMKLLRLGKDLIHYRNKSFDDLIPADFKEHCCQELIRKVKSSENEENKSFEYVITDSDNNLKSLKINFTILASFKLDEVILIGQYDIQQENLLLLKKNFLTYSTGALLDNSIMHKSFNPFEDADTSETSTAFGEGGCDDGKNNNIFDKNEENIGNLNNKIKNKNGGSNYHDKYKEGARNSSNNKSKISHQNSKRYFETKLFVKSSAKKKYATDNEQENYSENNDNNDNNNKNNNNNQIIEVGESIPKSSTKSYSRSRKTLNNSKIDAKKQTLNNHKGCEAAESSFYSDKNFLQIFERVDKSKNDSNKASGGFVSHDVEIVFFSSNLQSAFFIKSNWLTKIKAKYHLPFADIFEKVNQNIRKKEEDREKPAIVSICAINYDKYFLIYQRLVNYVEEEMSSEEIKENLRRFRHISQSSKISYFRFEFLYEIKIVKDEAFYLLFKIRQIKNEDQEMSLIHSEVNLVEKNNIFKNNNFNTDNSELGVLMETKQFEMDKKISILKDKDNQSISVSSNTFSATSKQDSMMALDSSRKTISNNDQRMNKFTIFSLIFCIFLVVYCLFFLVMGMINNNNIRKLYLIRNNFNDFRYFFYHTSMNFFFNLGINRNNEDYIVSESNLNLNNTHNNINDSYSTTQKENKNIESLFFQKFRDNKDISINISKYVVEELSVKLNMLRNIYVNLQNSIYSSHYKNSLDVIFNHKTKFLQINTIANEINVSFTDKYFFETINIFFNHGKVIVENMSANNSIYLSIINAKNDKINFRSQSVAGGTKLTEVQVKLYEILLNYINFYKNFIVIGDLMNQFFSDSLSEVFNSTYLLSFILMGIHLFLFIGGIFIVKFLYKIISQNDKMLCSSNDEGNIRFMREKLKSIKNLSMLFVENPRNLVISINKRRVEFLKKVYAENEKKKSYGKNSKNNKTSQYEAFMREKPSTANSSKEQNSLFQFGNSHEVAALSGRVAKMNVSYLDKFVILIPFVQMVLVLFVLYYLYSFIFYFIFRNSYNDFVLTSDFSNQNIELDNKMMNNINLLSTMMLLNKTEFDVSYDLSGKENKLMMELLTNILQIRTEITKYKKTNEKFKSIDDFEQNLMNCTFVYSNLNDSIFFELEKTNSFNIKNSNNNLIKSLISICDSYSFMKTVRLDSIFDEISYNSLHLYNLYDTSDKSYSDIVKIYENFMFYDVFLIFIFIFRPIRKFSSDYIYNNIIILSSNNYLVFTIIYLILNILVDLFIFYIINRMVVKRISDINKHLNNMITCICFKFSQTNKEKGD